MDEWDESSFPNLLTSSSSSPSSSFTLLATPPIHRSGVHHAFYSCFLSHSLVKGYTISFAYTLLMESSSILLSGGRLFPFLRQDLLFGLLFFAFRIVYHTFMLWKVRPRPRAAPFSSTTPPL